MIFLGALLNVLFTMRIPYLNIPCIVNETCFHGQCIHVDDYLINWYEFCLCDHSYSGYECNEQTKLSRTDWFIILICLISCLFICFCLLCIPFFYSFLKDDFYPQIIECARSTPYVEVSSPNSVKLTGMRVYRIPSEHLSRRQTIIDGLIPLHTISSLAYLTHFSNPRFQRRNEQIHTSTNEFN
ncbi:unnamed protein product [Adineta steineri]|uniref:EGF-like domain-containing protein n=1 Tax=Adineta steineri TaxID=433720 RepID=A0A820FYM7_9BILA|nr:unnamed protein product [Adineta steineri]CAF4270229.1 unnamed protein product [Adineta steineri]